MTSPRYTLLQSQLASRVLLLDGAMGSLIQGYGLSEDDFTGERFKNITPQMKGNNDILNITKPQVIKDIHTRYLKAGCDIIETNTFNGTSISQADYNTQEFVYEMNFQGAKNAREMADKFSTEDKPRFVALHRTGARTFGRRSGYFFGRNVFRHAQYKGGVVRYKSRT